MESLALQVQANTNATERSGARYTSVILYTQEMCKLPRSSLLRERSTLHTAAALTVRPAPIKGWQAQQHGLLPSDTHYRWANDKL
jgi:hypothetical protein